MTTRERQQHEVVSKQQGNVNITSKQQQVYVPSARISKQRDHQHISVYIRVDATHPYTRVHTQLFRTCFSSRQKSRRCSSQLDHRSAPEKSKAKQVRQALAPACCWRHAWLDVLRWHCLSRLDAMWPLKERKIGRHGSAAAAALAAPIPPISGASVPAGARRRGARILPQHLPTVRGIEETPRLQPRDDN